MSTALFRLAGDGDRATGGAIPLPDAFTAVLEELMDEGYATTGTLHGRISDVMRYSEQKIMTAAWRSWEQFSGDILLCLSEDMRLIAENSSGKWELTHEFVPDYLFTLPGLSKVIVTGRSKSRRQQRQQNSLVLQALAPVLDLIRESSGVNPLAVQLLFEAEKVLLKEVEQPLPEQPTQYRQYHPRPPHQQGKRLRVGLTAFFRKEFWEKYAKPGEWYALTDVSEIFNRSHPDQPPITHADLTGSMRKEGRDMVAAGVLESMKVTENGALKWKFRMKTRSHPGYGANASVVEAEPVVKWDNIRGDRRGGDPKV